MSAETKRFLDENVVVAESARLTPVGCDFGSNKQANIAEEDFEGFGTKPKSKKQEERNEKVGYFVPTAS